MGGQQSKPQQQSSNQSQPTGIYFSYLQQIKSSQPSEILPYYKSQLAFLEKTFRQLDKSNTKSLQLSSLSQLPFISSHPLHERIISLFDEELKKIKTKKISLQIFLHLLTPFHAQTQLQQKAKLLFRLYDWDKDFVLKENDLLLTLGMIFKEKLLYDRICDDSTIKNMASEAISKYGSRGQIKLQQFIDSIPHDQIRELMTFRFTKSSL